MGRLVFGLVFMFAMCCMSLIYLPLNKKYTKQKLCLYNVTGRVIGYKKKKNNKIVHVVEYVVRNKKYTKTYEDMWEHPIGHTLPVYCEEKNPSNAYVVEMKKTPSYVKFLGAGPLIGLSTFFLIVISESLS